MLYCVHSEHGVHIVQMSPFKKWGMKMKWDVRNEFLEKIERNGESNEVVLYGRREKVKA